MTDYTKIAREAKALQDSRGLELSEQKASEEPLRVFFRGLGIKLGDEATHANRDLYSVGMLTGEAVQGIVYHGQLADNVFHLTYGNSRRCDVRLDVSRNEIKATVAGEVHSSANGTVHALAFPLENDGACLKARIARSPEAVSGTIGAKEIAEIIVTGVIRGRFQ